MITRWLIAAQWICLAGAAVCFGSTVEPPRFDAVVRAAKESPHRAAEALKLLRAIAENRQADAPAEVGVQFGISATELRSTGFTSHSVRAAAYRAIGQLGTPDAISYLEIRSEGDFDSDEIHEVWSAALEALYAARLDRIAAKSERALFLETTIREDQDVLRNGYLSNWAAEQLCNHGPLTSYPVVHQLLYDRAGSEARERAEFCEMRMTTVSSNPDRITALASVLQVTDRLPHPKLVRWALRELSAMEEPLALQELERYEREILEVPESSPQKEQLMTYANEIRLLNGSRMAPAKNDPGRSHWIR